MALVLVAVIVVVVVGFEFTQELTWLWPVKLGLVTFLVGMVSFYCALFSCGRIRERP